MNQGASGMSCGCQIGGAKLILGLGEKPTSGSPVSSAFEQPYCGSNGTLQAGTTLLTNGSFIHSDTSWLSAWTSAMGAIELQSASLQKKKSRLNAASM